jgi:hypothetical protein
MAHDGMGALALLPSSLPPAKSSKALFGMCNASAGIDPGGGLFVVADDEDRISKDDPLPLRIYDSLLRLAAQRPLPPGTLGGCMGWSHTG